MKRFQTLSLLVVTLIGTLSFSQVVPRSATHTTQQRPPVVVDSLLRDKNQNPSAIDSRKLSPLKVELNVGKALNLKKGPDISGGGDPYSLEFIKIASNQVYPWLLSYGHLLRPKVDPEAFINSLNVGKISAIAVVYESCDGSDKGREVEACYNEDLDMIFISRKRFPVGGELSSTRTRLVAHEIFRRMKLPEGDAYNLSIQIVAGTRTIKTEFVQPETIFKHTFSRQRRATEEAPVVPTIRRDFTEDGRVIFSLCMATYYRLTQDLREIKSCQLKGRAKGYPVDYVSTVFGSFTKYAYGDKYARHSFNGAYSIGSGQFAGTGLGYGIGLLLGLSNPLSAAAIGAVVGISVGFKMHDWTPNKASINLMVAEESVATKQDNVVVVRARTNMTMIDGFDQVISILDANLN